MAAEQAEGVRKAFGSIILDLDEDLEKVVLGRVAIHKQGKNQMDLNDYDVDDEVYIKANSGPEMDPSTLKYVYKDEDLDHPELKRLMLASKIRAQVLEMMDAKARYNHPKCQSFNVKLEMLKTLKANTLELMELSKLNPGTSEREVILASLNCIGKIFQYNKVQFGLTIQDVGLSSVVEYCLKRLCDNYFDCEALVGRYELISEIFMMLRSEEILHFALELLTGAVKSALNRIHRVLVNTNGCGIVNMADMDVIFKCFELMEQIMANMNSVSEMEVFKLKSIERTVTRAIPYPLIVFNSARVAIIAESHSANSALVLKNN